MIKTTGIYHMGIPCNDVGRAVKFYTEVLGMTIAKLNNDDMGKGLNREDLRCGEGMVVLFQRPRPLEGDFVEREGATHQAFSVSREDFELAKAKMKESGVKVHSVASVDRPSGSGFYFFDTEGNLLQLYAPPKKRNQKFSYLADYRRYLPCDSLICYSNARNVERGRANELDSSPLLGGGILRRRINGFGFCLCPIQIIRAVNYGL